MNDFLADWQKPFKKWQNDVEHSSSELPDCSNLETVSGMCKWLSHPKNWKKTELLIIGWNGLIPWISYNHAWKLAPGCSEGHDLIMAILSERSRRRTKPKDDAEKIADDS